MKNILKAGVVAALCLSMGGCGDMGSGEKIGTVVMFRQHGIFCKTWEGEIIRGGFSGGSGVQGAPFYFTVEDPALVKQVQEALERQIEVKITFHTEMMTVCRSDSGDDFLTGIEFKTRPTTTVDTQVSGEVNTHASTPVQPQVAGTRDQQIQQLLETQAELIKKLAEK